MSQTEEKSTLQKQGETQVTESGESKKESESKPTTEEMQTEKVAFTLERDYVITLRKAYWLGRSKRAKRAINIIKKFVERHLKTQDIVLDSKVNEFVWARSIEKPPRRIKIHVGLTKEKKAYVYLSQDTR